MRRAFEAIIFIACYLLICVNCLELKPPTPRLGARANSYRRSMQPRSDEASGSRRKVIARVASLFLGSLSSFYLPSTSLAAQPVTLRETDSLGAMARRSLRPKPPKCLRRKLSQDFAVLLMRSSYNSLDLLDCVAMDQFQRDFFLIRSSEYEPYTKSLGPGLVQQGDLTDPYYFDFISFAQYQVINREITNDPPMMFEEQQPVDQGEDQPQKFVPVVVKRDPKITNDKLGAEHSRMVGSAILDRLQETFAGTDSALPKIAPMSRPSSETVVASIKQMLNLFLINGYAFGGEVSVAPDSKANAIDASGTKVTITLNAPAILWGSRILQNEKAKLSNDFFEKVITQLITRAGYVCSTSAKFEGNTEELVVSIL